MPTVQERLSVFRRGFQKSDIDYTVNRLYSIASKVINNNVVVFIVQQ